MNKVTDLAHVFWRNEHEFEPDLYLYEHYAIADLDRDTPSFTSGTSVREGLEIKGWEFLFEDSDRAFYRHIKDGQ